MADSFWFWSNITDISSIIDDDQNIRGGGGGGRRGYNQGCQEQEMNMNYTGVGVAGGRRYNEGGQEQEMNMMRSMMTRFEDDDHHQNTTATKKTKAIKKCGGRTCQKKPEKKTPKRGVGIAKLEETIKQKNSLLAAAADRQVYHGYPTTTAVAEVIPTTTYNHSHQPIPFHHPFLNRQQQKQTSTVFSSSSSVVNGDANTKHVFDGGQLDLNHVPNANIHENKGYDQVMKYGSSSTATNVSNNNQLMFKSHAPQTYLLHHQQQQQHGNNEARYYNPNPNAGSGTDRQHGNNNVAGYNSRPEVAELSSTQKQHQNYCLSQHSDHIWLNNQKNLNNGENIGGFTRLNNKSDFLESDLGRNWNSNYNNVNGRQLKKEFTSSSSIAATPGLVPTTGYSGVTAKGKSSLSSSSSSFYEFLSLTTGGIKGHHKKADYYDQQQQYYSSNYSSSSSSCIMEESGAACSSVRNGAAHDNISSSSQSNTTTHDHEFLDLSLKLSSYH